MKRSRFAAYNFGGAFLWVTSFIWGGYLFGNVPLIKENFGVVTILIWAAYGVSAWRRARGRVPVNAGGPR